MRLKHGLFTTLFVLALANLATLPAGEIEGGKDPVPADQFVEVKYKLEKGDDLLWKVNPKPSKMRTFKEGDYTYCIFNGPERKYEVAADLINWDARKRDYKTTEVVIGKAPNPPSPTPQPDGTLGLIKASREGLAKVTDKGKQVALAKAQRAHASAVGAGAFGTSAAKILDGWREANKLAVGEANTALWLDWSKEVSTQVQRLYNGGKLPTNTEWVAAFNEMAEGLGG